MDVSYRTTLELDKIIARAVQLCTCAETKEMTVSYTHLTLPTTSRV
mgnify:CR=1 FL=1